MSFLNPHKSWWDEKVARSRAASAPLVEQQEEETSSMFGSKMAVVSVLGLCRFTVEFLNHLLEPFIPLIKRSQDLTNVAVVALEGAFSMGFLIGTLCVPYMIGKVGSKRVMMFASAMMLLSTAFAFVLPEYFELLVARLVQGFAGGVVLVSSFDLLAKLFLGREPKGFMLSTAMLTASSALGTAMGVLSCLLVDEKSLDIRILRIPFFVAGVLTAILLACRYLLNTPFDAPYIRKEVHEQSVAGELRLMFTSHRTFPLLGSIFLLWLVVLAWSATIPLWFSTTYHSGMYVQAAHVAGMFFCVFFGNILGGFLMETKRASPATLWIVGYTGMLPAIFFMLVKIEMFDNLALAIGGLSMGVFGSAIKCLLALVVEPQYYTVVYSACYLMQAFAGAIATIGGTFITTEFGFVSLQAVFVVSVLLFLPWVSGTTSELGGVDETTKQTHGE